MPENINEDINENAPPNGEQKIEEAARSAITKAGGNAELLLPHIKAKMGWRKDGDEVIVFSDKGEGDDGCNALVNSYRDNPNFSQAFTPSGDASSQAETQSAPETEGQPEAQGQTTSGQAAPQEPKMGSGAVPSASFTPNAVDGGDPLAIGHALKGIASGQMRVRFDG